MSISITDSTGRVVVEKVEKFPYFRFRKRVTGQERLYMVWHLLDCHNLKITEHQAAKIPKKFYRDRPEKS